MIPMIDTGVDNAYYSCGGGRGRHRVEEFHLLFLARLARRVPPALFVLKGGCNLRFFHGSIRYSEDIDLDLGPIGVGAFRDKVRDLLSSRPFAQILETRGVAIERVSEPEQTDTTLRWKIGLRAEGTGAPLPTKIECSRRGLEDGVVLGRVDPPVARAHRLGVWALPNRVDPLALPVY